jgi:DNA-binding transcriptional MocR family regulator
MPEQYLERIRKSVADDRSPAGIAAAVGRLVGNGSLGGGERLPTVRSLARALDVSPSTVTDAWRRLQHAGLVSTEGRRGSFVRARRQPDEPGRFWQVPVDPHTYRLDLSTGTPDPRLLPPLGPALAALHDEPPVSSYLDSPTLPALAEVLREDWPFEPQTLTIVDGAMDALDRIIDTVVTFGDRVIVETPGFPPTLDMLELAGAELVPVPVADGGPDLAALAAAVGAGASAFVLQPRSHNPTGWSVDADHVSRMADLLRGTGILVIEDDHSGTVSGAPLHSVGAHLPDQVVHIRSFSKSYGPDLRLAAIGGTATVIDAVIHRRQLGPAWSSRLLQRVLLHLLTDPSTDDLVTRAAETYGKRRRMLCEALADRGFQVPGRSGFNLWLEVADETNALIALSARGIGAAPGSPFMVGEIGSHHLRLTVSMVDTGTDDLADDLAAAASIPPGRRVGA